LIASARQATVGLRCFHHAQRSLSRSTTALQLKANDYLYLMAYLRPVSLHRQFRLFAYAVDDGQCSSFMWQGRNTFYGRFADKSTHRIIVNHRVRVTCISTVLLL